MAPHELPDIYSNASVFVDTSKTHGFGRTGVEAMACGTPCVLSDSGGISEYATHDVNARIVDVGDVAGTTEAVEQLLDDVAIAERLSHTGITTASKFGDYRAALDLLGIIENWIRGR